jgi:hypothetical protein
MTYVVRHPSTESFLGHLGGLQMSREQSLGPAVVPAFWHQQTLEISYTVGYDL